MATSENGTPSVSVIVPVYRVEPYLRQCLNSLAAQTHTRLTVWLIDDASPDGSGAICDEFAAKDGRFRVIHKPVNAGVSAARNDGLAAAWGDYIGFVDADDWVEPDYIESLLETVRTTGADVGICGWQIHDRPDGQTHGGEAGANRLLTPHEALRFANDVGHSFEGYVWNKLFPAAIFRETEDGAPRFRFREAFAICEDLLLLTEIFASGRTACYTPRRLYHYRYRASSALRTFDEKRMSEYAARERITAVCQKADPTGELAAIAELSHVKSALNNLAAARAAHDRKTGKALRDRIDSRLWKLLTARCLPRYERLKLLVRRAAPVWSLRLWQRGRRR